MVILRSELTDNINNTPKQCFEFDEWANNGVGSLYSIDCSLSTPTRAATLPPQWWIDSVLSELFTINRLEENRLLMEDLELNEDDFYMEFPERDLNSEESSYLRSIYPANNQPTDIPAFVDYAKILGF
ncbi:MAG: hypothetical protein V7L13_29430 [Nostoc sp.]|uniref:hypothetical protein n=1 Tax=Nostoc sp. TaxID=1180 RepID=UPI002FFD4F9C